MKKWIVAILFVLVIAFFSFYKDAENMDLSENVLFSKESSWGPCENESNNCYYRIYIYENGLVVEHKGSDENQTKIVSDEDIKRIKDKIIETGVMEKDCGRLEVLDYWAIYFIKLDEERVFQYPACEEELEQVDDVISEVLG